MPLLTLRNIHHAFGAAPLLDGIDFSIDAGERVCLVGRNGSGKSTLLKIIAGTLVADEGELVRDQGLRIAELSQEVPEDASGSVFDIVASGLGSLGQLLRD